MASTGIAKRWTGPFGLVEMEDGTVIRIDTEQIDGGKLRVGYEVKFDIETVKNQKRGTNVSGEAVLAKDATLTPEQQEADKKKIEEMREKQEKAFNALLEDIEKLSQPAKNQLLRNLESKLGESYEIIYDKDKRMDGKKAFTKGEFLAFYGPKVGPKKWASASKNKGTKSRKGKKEKEAGDEAEAPKAEAEAEPKAEKTEA